MCTIIEDYALCCDLSFLNWHWSSLLYDVVWNELKVAHIWNGHEFLLYAYCKPSFAFGLLGGTDDKRAKYNGSLWQVRDFLWAFIC